MSKKTDNKENRYMIARKSAKKKINQAEVESELHICHDKFSKIENGYIFPDAKELKTLSLMYDCDIDYLVGIQNEKKKTYKHASEETGLSYKAIETLKEDPEICKIVSDLLESKKILMLIKEAKKADTIAKRGIAKDDMIKEKELRELKTWEAIRQYIGD